MTFLQRAQELSSLADKDKASAEWLFEGGHYPQAIYMLCQAIEKVLKGFFVVRYPDRPVPKTHDLLALANKNCLKLSTDQMKLLDDFTMHYQRVRYSDLAQRDFSTLSKTGPWMEKGGTIYVWIQQQLNQF